VAATAAKAASLFTLLPIRARVDTVVPGPSERLAKVVPSRGLGEAAAGLPAGIVAIPAGLAVQRARSLTGVDGGDGGSQSEGEEGYVHHFGRPGGRMGEFHARSWARCLRGLTWEGLSYGGELEGSLRR